MKNFFALIIGSSFLACTALANVCERAPIVIEALTEKLHKSCNEIGPTDLGGITQLNIQNKGSYQNYTLDEGDFVGLEHLENLSLEGHFTPGQHGGLKSLSAKTFEPLKSLKTISLEKNCPLDGLEQDLFQNLAQLKSINLSYCANSLTAVPQRLFHNLHQLEILDLSWNEITTLDPKLFEGLINLQSLNLIANNLSTLDGNTFDDLGSLKELYIGTNPWSSDLPAFIFKPLQKLENLNIWGIPLSSRAVLSNLEFHYLKNLKTLNLEMTYLTEAEYDAIQSQVPWAHVIRNYGN